jgi:hypothetical protein
MTFMNPIMCSWCDVKFETFEAYDGHLPCAKMPPGGNIE